MRIGLFVLGLLFAQGAFAMRVHTSCPAGPLQVGPLEVPVPDGFTCLQIIPCPSGGVPRLGGGGTDFEIHRKGPTFRSNLLIGQPVRNDGLNTAFVMQQQWSALTLDAPYVETAVALKGAVGTLRQSTDRGPKTAVLVVFHKGGFTPMWLTQSDGGSKRDAAVLLAAMLGTRVAAKRDPFDGGTAP